ncbi:hypothetical protein SAMN05421753_1199 [Planctomicrobium piriforme]|uniref:Uncharacterized protein n=1 Tax=Planctomicrobium piriforme TaxID=1576369 RepID=A0A1I3QS37_9PLAN|nr:hypothetical protein SAMN05421753_1199 [Planctomicrobium piriforme]
MPPTVEECVQVEPEKNSVANTQHQCTSGTIAPGGNDLFPHVPGQRGFHPANAVGRTAEHVDGGVIGASALSFEKCSALCPDGP